VNLPQPHRVGGDGGAAKPLGDLGRVGGQKSSTVVMPKGANAAVVSLPNTGNSPTGASAVR